MYEPRGFLKMLNILASSSEINMCSEIHYLPIILKQKKALLLSKIVEVVTFINLAIAKQ